MPCSWNIPLQGRPVRAVHPDRALDCQGCQNSENNKNQTQLPSLIDCVGKEKLTLVNYSLYRSYLIVCIFHGVSFLNRFYFVNITCILSSKKTQYLYWTSSLLSHVMTLVIVLKTTTFWLFWVRWLVLRKGGNNFSWFGGKGAGRRRLKGVGLEAGPGLPRA